MNSLTDQQLLRDFAGHRSEPAFSELVQRHVDLVYSAALRTVRDTHLAEDVTQGVFVALAQNAARLTDRQVLSGWLHRTAQNLAANAVRSDVRRRAREQEAAVMNELSSSAADAPWETIARELDAALNSLSELDQDALLLRYFERKSAGEMAQILGLTNEAAQKRVNRAVERLRNYFSKRNVAIGAGGLAAVLAANAVQSAPIGLAASVTIAGTAAHVPAVIAAATKTIAMTLFQKTLAVTVLAVIAGVEVYQTHQASRLRQQYQALTQQQAPLTERLAQLQADNGRLSNIVAQAGDEKALSQRQFGELLKLRNQTSQANEAMQELAKLKTSGAQSTASMPSFLTNALAQGISVAEKARKKLALAQVERMQEKLHLSPEQAQAIRDIMTRNIEQSCEATRTAMMAKPFSMPDSRAFSTEGNEQSEIEAVLTPDQLAAYSEFKQEETAAALQKSVQADLAGIVEETKLSPGQQGQVEAALYQLKANQASADQGVLNQARATGNMAEVVSLQLEVQKKALEDKIKILEGILPPEQLKSYEQKQWNKLDLQASAMKMFLPLTNNTSAR